MRKIVIDTNVLISSKLSSVGSPAKIMDLIDNGEVRLYFSQKIFDEYERKLANPKFRISITNQKKILEDIRDTGIFVDEPVITNIKVVEKDRAFYDVAKQHKIILVTGDKKDLLCLDEDFIMTPADYLKHINQAEI